MVYYKVVEQPRTSDELTSALLHTDNPFFRVYRKNGKNQIVKSGMAFTDLEDAKELCSKFDGLYGDFQIWTCTGKKVELPKRGFVSDAPGDYMRLILPFILYGKRIVGKEENWCFIADDASFPQGTVRLRNLKLKERVL
jgi:hypothetical protein